jgi:NitT/TauT family transport system permease protein
MRSSDLSPPSHPAGELRDAGETQTPPDGGTRRSWLTRLDPRTQLERASLLIVFVIVWHVAVERQWVEPIYAATPGETASSLRSFLGDETFWSDLSVTLRTALAGWAVGAATGLFAGLLLGRWRHARRVLGPYLTFVNAVPKIALAPIIILWFGIGESSKVALAALVVFFIVQVPTTAAVALTDPDLDTVATTLGATEAQKYFKVYLPGILAAVFGALRLGAIYALLAVVFGEFLAARSGLGQRLISATNQFNMDHAFALVIVLALLALTINGGIGLVERRLLRWQESGAQGAVVTM